MKKVFAILLVALCCLSVFAKTADIKMTGKVAAKVEIGNKGITSFDLDSSIRLEYGIHESLSACLEIAPDFEDSFNLKISQCFVYFNLPGLEGVNVNLKLGLQDDVVTKESFFGLFVTGQKTNAAAIQAKLSYDPAILDLADDSVSFKDFNAWVNVAFKESETLKYNFGLNYANTAENRLSAFAGLETVREDGYTFDASCKIERDAVSLLLTPSKETEFGNLAANFGLKFNLGDDLDVMFTDAQVALTGYTSEIDERLTADFTAGYLDYAESQIYTADDKMPIDKGWFGNAFVTYAMYPGLVFDFNLNAGFDSMKDFQWNSYFDTKVGF